MLAFPQQYSTTRKITSHLTLLIFNLLSVVEYREAEYRDHQFQGFFGYFGLDTAENHRLLDHRSQ
jgi:hypothetical protein